ncbi:MAG: hypothetical protein D6772_00605 [Bacteroidetes bacterium]|nr:MAG: hypothetical protein D6772_00605 [Bacteroidota bacterium]
MKYIFPYVMVLVLLGGSQMSYAQVDFIIVEDLQIEGNKKTRAEVLLREMPFAPGDTIRLDELVDKVDEAERQLMNTGLFVSADISYADWEGSTGLVTFLVTVAESWYIYPLPTFELADRNFNVWWKDQGRSLQRVNIGMNFEHENFTGWRDELDIGFEYGYTRAYRISYDFPYLNRRKTIGLWSSMEWGRRREVNYATQANKQAFFRDDDRFLQQQVQIEFELSWRPALYSTHTLAVGFYQDQVDQQIIEDFNPNYFTNGSNEQRYLSLAYLYQQDLRDNRDYPWKGYNWGGSLTKDGLGIYGDRNALTLELYGERYWSPHPGWSLGLGARGKYSLLRRPQSYQNNRAIGFGRSRVIGYELFLVDGLDMALLRSNVRFELWRGQIEFGRWVFLEAFRKLPLRLNLSLSYDVAYVNSPFNTGDNPLNNRLFSGVAPGLDLVLYYDYAFRIQYSYSDQGMGSVVLGFRLGI